MTARASAAGDGMLHPVALGAVAVLLVNDHFLKAAFPGAVTGKLSDLAGLAFFPVFLQACIELAASWSKRFHGPSERALLGACIATGVVFTLVKTTPLFAEAYRHGLGALQWPVLAAATLVRGGELQGPVAVRLAMDPTDLFALPALSVAYRLGLPRTAGGER